jgi:hypothetical protein
MLLQQPRHISELFTQPRHISELFPQPRHVSMLPENHLVIQDLESAKVKVTPVKLFLYKKSLIHI